MKHVTVSVDESSLSIMNIERIRFEMSDGDACQPNEIRCVDRTRGRKCVQKFWTCDGDR